MNKRDTYIWLNSIRGIGNITIDKLEVYFKNISNIWEASKNEIFRIPFISNKIKHEIIKCKNLDYFDKLKHTIKKNNVKVITIVDKEYPQMLKNIYNYPKVLYVKGNIEFNKLLSIAIVGSRKATSYGRWAAEKFAKELSRLGITIVSGMAKGIDTVAHIGALEENGQTIAVLGSGLNVIYPSSNRILYEKIIEKGAVISEFPLNTKPLPQNFPQRNRIISGLSLGTVVIEAGEKSGSLITASHALEQGKDVFALPGNINSTYSKGTNMLIRDGAKILMDIDCILEEISELRGITRMKKSNHINYDDLSDQEIKILECIIEKPIHCDMISYKTGIDISTVSSILTILEMKGIIKQLPGKIFMIN